jgi:electron transport complex protein RnfC
MLGPKIPYRTGLVSLEAMDYPKEAILLFAAPENGPAPAVRPGEDVATGKQLSGGGLSGFSTVSGKVKSVEPFEGINGERYHAVRVETGGKDEWAEKPKPDPEFLNKAPGEITERLNALGFDTGFAGRGLESVLVGAIDADPVTQVNQQALLDSREHLKQGIELLVKITGARKSAVAAAREHCRSQNGVPLVPVHAVYPAGVPDLLLRSMVRQDRVGEDCLYIGAARLVDMVRALETGVPRIEKTVTLSGKGVKKAVNLKVRIGTPVAEILSKYDIPLHNTERVLLNGVFNGQACYSAQYPVTVGTDSIYIQNIRETVPYESGACVNCGKCAAVCPTGLEVNLLCRFAEYSFFDECKKYHIDDCVDCGLCSYVCMARRPLGQLINFAKREIGK